MGSEAELLTLQQWLGLIIAAIAMWVYNLKDEVDASGNEVKGAHATEEAKLRVPSTVTLSRAPSMSDIERPRISGFRASGTVRPTISSASLGSADRF